MAKILDVCCGSKMFWFDKNNKNTTYMDIRKLSTQLCDGRVFEVNPDVIGDFRNIPFNNNSYDLVVFDPPHLFHAGDHSWLGIKYGILSENWQTDIKQGFSECFRVLKPNGFLIFKWCEEQIKLSEILKLCDCNPLFGNKRAKTHWIVFLKGA